VEHKKVETIKRPIESSSDEEKVEDDRWVFE